MTEAEIQLQVTSAMGKLPLADQMSVLQYVRSLKKPKVLGRPGRELLHLAGTLSDEDAKEMLAAIEEDCEKVDPNEW